MLSPYTFRSGHTVANRLALAPLTNGQSDADGTLGADEKKWLLMRAQGGFGSIITAASHIHPHAKGFHGQVGCYLEKHFAALELLAHESKLLGAATLLQMYHGGVRSGRIHTGVQPTAPSSVEQDFPGFETPRALASDEIDSIIENFVTSAVMAQRHGLSGVEVHGANGYLFTQFISSYCNLRTDKWGGSLEARAQPLILTAQKIRQATQKPFIVGVRISVEDLSGQKGFDIIDTIEISRMLDQCGIDYIHLSQGSALACSERFPSLTNLSKIRSAISKDSALMSCGGIVSAELSNQCLEHGADLVAIGKHAILEPNWPKLAAKGTLGLPEWPAKSSQLAHAGVGPAFIEYLRKFKSLVQD